MPLPCAEEISELVAKIDDCLDHGHEPARCTLRRIREVLEAMTQKPAAGADSFGRLGRGGRKAA